MPMPHRPAPGSSTPAKPTKTKPPATPPSEGDGGTRPAAGSGAPFSERRLHVIMALTAALLAAAVFSGTLHGDWVYDDEPLILANPMIQDPHHFWTSLGSDVFAYRSAQGEAGSPYWRPVTTLWFIINHRLYGVESTLGWHVGSIALHTLATLLAFLVMRRLGMGPLAAGAAAWIFAVHPTRTENVAWISGVPDLLVAVGLLGSLWFVLGILERRDAPADDGVGKRPAWGLWAAAVVLYAMALGAKEFSIVFPLIVFAAALRWRQVGGGAGRGGEGADRLRPDLSGWRSAAAHAAPFAAMAVAYLVIRAPIVEGASEHAEGPGLSGAILSLPLTGAFYLRQILFPYWIGPTYPLRPVTEVGVLNFLLPAAVVAAAGAGMLWLSLGRHASRPALLGTLLFVLTIAPAGMAAGMAPELMVQDRYLYLPLLGFAMVALAGAQRLLGERLGARGGVSGDRRAAAVLTAAAAVACIPLAAQTFRYSAAWMSNIDLWAWGVRNDPGSRFPWGQYGAALVRAGKYEEAKAAIQRAIELRQTVSNTLALIDLHIRTQQYDEAERILLALIKDMDTRPHTIERFHAVEQLVRVALLRDEDVERALALYRDVRQKLPNFRAMITDRIAVILMVEGRRDEALAELESVRDAVATDRSQDAWWVYYRLGQLYAERGRLQEAAAAFTQFLQQTERTGNLKMIEARELAARAVEAIRRGPSPESASVPGSGAGSPPAAAEPASTGG